LSGTFKVLGYTPGLTHKHNSKQERLLKRYTFFIFTIFLFKKSNGYLFRAYFLLHKDILFHSYLRQTSSQNMMTDNHLLFQVPPNQRSTANRSVRYHPDLRYPALLRHLRTEGLHPRQQPRAGPRCQGQGLAQQPSVSLLQQGALN
jgi:hypothetical protein